MKISAEAATANQKLINEMQKRWKEYGVNQPEENKTARLIAEVAVLTEMVRVLSDVKQEQRSNSEQLGEPVAWMKEGWGPDCGPYIEFYRDDEMGWRDKKEWMPLYTTPQQRKPLTDEQLMIALLMVDPETKRLPVGFRAFARAIEAAHGIKE